MNSEELIKELISLNPELEYFYNSQQYKISLHIIQKLVEYGYTSKQMANHLNLDHGTYIRMESGDDTISLEEYERVSLLL